MPFRRFVRACSLVLVAACSAHFAVGNDDFEGVPIEYSKATPDNVVTRLQKKLDAGETKLRFDPHFGYLRDFLKELGVPTSSQMLVYSKTSLQRQQIAPRTPRSLFFNDEIYVGFCQDGDVLEISVVDPQLGAVFYSLNHKEVERPTFVRHTDNCMICHASSHTQGVPGHMVRSVYSDPAGYPILSAGSFRIDHTSPLKTRWGGWYVTGTHGTQMHLGNMIFRGKVPDVVENKDGLNLTKLDDRIDRTGFLTPHSDIVALMVLEHQGEAHNLLTKANFQTRLALHHEKELNRELGEPADHRWQSTTSRIKSVCEPLVQYFLMSGEAPLEAAIRGTSGYAEEFARQGPRDGRGRSLRDLDLTTRLFRYPCSYLVYSPSFDALPQEARDYFWRRMHAVLQGKETGREFAHLTPELRRELREILLDTKPGLPEIWKQLDVAAAEPAGEKPAEKSGE